MDELLDLLGQLTMEQAALIGKSKELTSKAKNLSLTYQQLYQQYLDLKAAYDEAIANGGVPPGAITQMAHLRDQATVERVSLADALSNLPPIVLPPPASHTEPTPGS